MSFVDRSKLAESLRKALESSPKRNFKQAVELIIVLRDVDVKSPEGRIREIVFMPVDEAVRRYEEGIRRFGVETYRQCGNLRGWYNVARCLHDAKKTKEVSLELMVRNFREAS